LSGNKAKSLKTFIQKGITDYLVGSAFSAFMKVRQLNSCFVGLNEQAEQIFFHLGKALSEKERLTKTIKSENQMLDCRRRLQYEK
jgi:hypothetical protein